MRKFIFSGIVASLVAAFLIISLRQVLAQQKVETPKPVRAVVVPAISGITPGKAYLTGGARLAGGTADVGFEKEVFKVGADIKVIVTPVGSWSGIYVMNVSSNGFTARSGAGDPDAEFNWIAVSGK